MKNKTFILFLFCFRILDAFRSSSCQGQADHHQLNRGTQDHEVHVGVIVDMGSSHGKLIQSCISLAISDFYSLHYNQSPKLRVVFNVRDSRGDPFQPLSAALNLLQEEKVRAIILGGQTSSQANVLAEFGDRKKIPVISIPKSTSFPSISSSISPFFVQIAQHDQITSQVKGIAALIEIYKWRNVILIHEENELNINDDDDTISYMLALFQEKNIRISFISVISTSSEDPQIIEQLHELKTLQTSVFIVHLSHFLASRVFVNAKRLGMMSKGYAWIVTSKSMNQLNYLTDSSIFESMEGALGFSSYIPASEEIHNLTSRLRSKFGTDHEEGAPDAMQLNLFGLLAYDVGWSLAKAAEKLVPDARPYLIDLDTYDSMLLQEILRYEFKGLVGEFRFINGIKPISNAFEIVNVVNNGEIRRVGFSSSTGRISRQVYNQSNHRRQLSFTNDLQSVIWPGGSLNIPQGRLLQTSGKILKIGVPVKIGFSQLLKVKRDPRTNATEITGFCIDVFKAALEGLNYQVQYQFIPFIDANGNMAGTYNDLIYQVYLQKFDAVVGDTTINAARSQYVDFTMSFTDIGVGIVEATKNNDMWIFWKPLTPQLWLTSLGFLLISGFVIWLIEHQSLHHSTEDVLPPKQNGFSLSLLIGRWDEMRNQWSVLVATISLFVLFILSSSYTATLASMMTVQHIELNSKRSYVGYLAGSNIMTGVLTSNLNFENSTLRPFVTEEDVANALSKGSKNGGVSAILDEISYIKIFLAEYPTDYSLIKTLPTTNGFGFVFPKGSLLVPDISREIARLRESGRLDMLETAWFKSQTSLTDGANNVKPLTPTNFGGLFLLSSILSILAFLIFQIRHWDDVRRRMRNFFNICRQLFHQFPVYMFRRIRRVESNAIHPQVQMT